MTELVFTGAAPDGATVIVAEALVPLPDDRAHWIRRTLRAGLSTEDALELVADVLDRTATGWPLRVVLTRTAGRWRLHGFYAFLEHAGVASVEGATREVVEAARQWLRTGAPRWNLGVVALASLWDIPVGASPPRAADAPAPSVVDTAASHHLRGVAYARAGQPREAIAAWEAAAGLDPLYVDGLYNAGIAHHGLGELAAALACWERGLARAPRDFWFTRKIIQAHNALGRYAEAGAARLRLLDIWATSTDPAVRRAHEYVFVQSAVDGREVHGCEVLAALDAPPTLYFEPVHAAGAHVHGSHPRIHVLPLAGGAVRIELETADGRNELAVLPQRPQLPALLARVHAWLAQASS